jgi:hypothetical protein
VVGLWIDGRIVNGGNQTPMEHGLDTQLIMVVGGSIVAWGLV